MGEPRNLFLHGLFFSSLGIEMEFVLSARAEVTLSGLTSATFDKAKDSQGTLGGL